MVGREVEGICIYFRFCEFQLCIDIHLNCVCPVSVVPHVEVLLIGREQHITELFLFVDDGGVDLEKFKNKPLAVTPQRI